MEMSMNSGKSKKICIKLLAVTASWKGHTMVQGDGNTYSWGTLTF